MKPIQQTQGILFKWVMAGGASLCLTLAAAAQVQTSTTEPFSYAYFAAGNISVGFTRLQDASRTRQWRTVIKMDVAEGISRSISLLSGEVIPSFESYWR
jgi:hypothetical protein